MRRLLPVLALLIAAPALAQPAASFDPDTVRAYPLDGGKMWLFEDPPTGYLEETYGFTPDAAWFERARLAALRMPGCSASFVSPTGLVATNHHCAQGSVVGVSEEGEGLLDAGFSARSRAEERPVDGMYMDQLVEIVDVTDELGMAAGSGAAREAIETRLLTARGVAPGDETADFVVQIVDLYDGGKISAYVFRRYRDVRLVFAPEARLGYFGGDFDNFTYPRYALDFAFYRIYGDDGQPVETEHYFPLSPEGVDEGDLVFVIGNPGRTNRGYTVAQLEYARDVELPSTLGFINSRAAALQAYLNTGPDNPDAVRSQLFGLLNAQKAFGGRLNGISDPYIVARRAVAEQDFIAASPEAAGLVAEMEQVVEQKTALATETRAFAFLFNRAYGSALLKRARAVVNGESPDAITAGPNEEAYLAAEIESIQAYYAAKGLELPKTIQTDAPSAAAWMLEHSGLAEEHSHAGGHSHSTENDPAVALVQDVLPRAAAWSQSLQSVAAEERDLAEQLGRARYEAYGKAVPPDATFSLRFTDGIVTGYPYNGTQAPPMTTLYGLFDHHYSYCVAGQGSVSATECDWLLPEQWLAAEDRLDLSTPVNFTSTSDTIGGNSGSPVLDRQLRLVGLNFDRTIEGLVRDYLYAPERGRNVMVDTRVVLEALRNVYGLPALADELTGEVR
ncbi:MAG: S46 family peptidase [Bacteroidota bacterium]